MNLFLNAHAALLQPMSVAVCSIHDNIWFFLSFCYNVFI